MSIDKLKTKFFTGAWLTDVKHYFTKINEIIDWVNNIGTPSYKVYTALLNQENTDAPTTIILQNTIGNILWSYNGNGNYYGNLTNAFDLNKTFVLISQYSGGAGLVVDFIAAEVLDSSTIVITTTTDNVFIDNLLHNVSIEIRVYN